MHSPPDAEDTVYEYVDGTRALTEARPQQAVYVTISPKVKVGLCCAGGLKKTVPIPRRQPFVVGQQITRQGRRKCEHLDREEK